MLTSLNKDQTQQTRAFSDKCFIIHQEAEKKGFDTLQQALDLSLQLANITRKTNVCLEQNFDERLTGNLKLNLQVK